MLVGFGKKERIRGKASARVKEMVLFTRWGWSGALASLSFPKVLLK